MMTDLRVIDFSGGQTEDYLDCPPNYGKSVKDFNIDGDKRLLQRPGASRNPVTQLPSGTQIVNAVFDVGLEAYSSSLGYPNDLIAISKGNIYRYATATSTWTLINTYLMKLADTVHVVYLSDAQWVIHGLTSATGTKFPYLLYYSGGFKFMRLGHPQIAATYTITPQAADAKKYVYFLLYVRTYSTIGGVVHKIMGPPKVISVSNAGDMSGAGHYNDLANIPKCDDTGELKLADGYRIGSNSADYTRVYIYRTTHNGTVPYYVASVPYTDSTAVDYITDASLVAREVLYTAGGEVDHEPIGTVVGDRDSSYHAHFARTDTGKMYYGIGYRVTQTFPGNPEYAPASFSVFTTSLLTALHGLSEYGIAFCYGSILRVEGFIDSLGMGDIYLKSVSSSIGCAARYSVVRAENKLYFLSANGIGMTDGYTAVNLTPHLSDTLAIPESTDRYLSAYDQCNGVFDPESNTIRWNAYWMSPKKVIVLHLDHTKFTEGGGAVTFWEPDTNLTCLSQTRASVYGDARGYAHTFDEALLTDEQFSTPLNAWVANAVVPEYTSGAWSLGSELYKKWVTKMEAVFDNLSNLCVQFFHANDLVATFTEIAPMSFLNFATEKKVIRRVTRFSRSLLRATYKQIKLKKAYIILYRYQNYSLATTSGIDDVILNSHPPNWPTDIVGQYMYFETIMVGGVQTADNFTTGFLIKTRSDDTVVIEANAALYPKASALTKWVIKGYGKDQKMRLLGYTIPYQTIGVGQQPHATVGEDAP
jgi:hypothetical protein